MALNLSPMAWLALALFVIQNGCAAIILNVTQRSSGYSSQVAVLMQELAIKLPLCGLFYIVWRHPLADVALRAMAPAGAMFAFLTLVTGAFWGKPMWGAWWVWDARLTSMLILLFFYLGVIALANGFDQPERGSRPAALLALVGVINVPIVKFSVDWWNTLHQPASLLRSGGVSIDQAMLVPLLLMLAGMHCYFAVIVILRMKAILAERRPAAAAGL